MIIMKDLSTKDVVVKEEKESSESENESENSGSDNIEKMPLLLNQQRL
jgi:hypothetical protein